MTLLMLGDRANPFPPDRTLYTVFQVTADEPSGDSSATVARRERACPNLLWRGRGTILRGLLP